MNKTQLVVAAIAFGGLGIGQAQADSLGDALKGRPYVGFQAGANFGLESDVAIVGTASEAEYDPDFYLGLAFGYALEPRSWGAVRAEFEPFFRRSEPDEDGAGPAIGSSDGEVDVYGAMFNVIYSPEQLDWPVYPYIGGGVGLAEIDARLDLANGAGRIDDDDEVFAYQGIVGVRWPLNDFASFTIDGRYFGVADPELTAFNGTTVDLEYDAITATAGFHFRF